MELINYLQYNSVLILSFFFLSVLVLFLNKITFGASNRTLFSTSEGSLLNPLTYIRLFTHILGHEDWRHLSNNFVYILLIGPMLEEKYGTYNLLIMILITAAVIGIINFVIGKKRIYGASGIVFMFIIMSSFVNVEERKIPLTLILIFLFYIVNEIIDGIAKNDGISHMGHLLGAICGAVYGFYFLYFY